MTARRRREAEPSVRAARSRRRSRAVLAVAIILGALCLVSVRAAIAVPTDPTPPSDPTSPSVSIDIDGTTASPSTTLMILAATTVLSVAPSLILMLTSFTKIFVVLSLARNALGLQGVPPNQVLAGLALFLSLFIMEPVLSDINDAAIQPYLSGALSFSQALTAAVGPLHDFMTAHTRQEDIALLTRAAGRPNPVGPADVALSTLVPAFMLSELRAAFIIGFVIYVPFLVIDLVVASILMSMGMMMLPPVMISLPFKILLFVMVDGWSLIVTNLVSSY